MTARQTSPCCPKRTATPRGSMLAALLLQNEAVVPEHRARELLPLSMQELGDVIVPESTLDGDTLRGPDGETIGKLRSDGTVAVSPEAPPFPLWQDADPTDATVIGRMNRAMGHEHSSGHHASIFLSSVSGLPLDSVVASQSTVQGITVMTADGHKVGDLQDDGKTVLDGDGNLAGVRRFDGAIVGGSIASWLAPPNPHGSWGWADTAALTMPDPYVCNVSKLPEEHAADHPALHRLEDLLLPNGTHLLIYGTSHARSVRQVLTSVARYFKHRVTSRLLSGSDDRDTSADGSPGYPAELTCGILGDRPCWDAGLRREEIEGEGGHAIITSVTNHAQYQLPEHADRLDKLIVDADPPITHAYYMHAHPPEYFEAQCIKATTGVMPDPTKVGDNAEQEACDITTPACQASTAQFAPFAKRLPQVGVRGTIRLKHTDAPTSAAARVCDTYRDFIQGHIGPYSMGQGSRGMRATLSAQVLGRRSRHARQRRASRLRGRVLRSAGLRQCFKGWKGCDPLWRSHESL